LKNVSYSVLRSTTLEPPDLIRAANELQLEGVIAKRKSSLDDPGTRSGAWLKYKLNQFRNLLSWLDDGRQSIRRLIVGCYEGADLKFVAKVRNGFVPRTRAPSAICQRNAARCGHSQRGR